ncbi:type IV secretion system protein [Altererythrobacter sp. GH1-8]|uniref:type IV secretion system protein n=1 Tax=Altererythrobacter sp. GH1-8 TaxID=3349333 RepID=UPI00374DA2FB
MSTACDHAIDNLSGGVAGALTAIDCMASEVTSETFGRLFAPGGSLGAVLTILLTLYVAFFAIALLLGRSSLDVRALMPRMITLGLVLTFATSWVAYQSVVWNLAIGAPDWLAGLLLGSEGSATQSFGAKLDVVFAAVQQTTAGDQNFSTFSPPGMMWLGALLLLLGTVGLLVTAKIGLALLVALGPIFVVMALFNPTRGLFAGWLKGVVMLALVPLFAVLGGSIMLELAVPVLAALAAVPNQVDPQAAMAFFLIGAVHCALMAMVLKVASAMVAGWQVFGLAAVDQLPIPSDASSGRLMEQRLASQRQDSQGQKFQGSRRIDISAERTHRPANDTDSNSGTSRSARAFATASAESSASTTASSPSRTRGIGSQFRSPRKSAQIKPEIAS